ncbi:glycine zipper 2TM domain-containing protein [Novosphingobium tardum]|uniref:17 kDa surface antigen n=1 Tax=Novosphingobium tardum TaxID=1538021 RepID=A0ABV8RM22_9SPHN
MNKFHTAALALAVPGLMAASLPAAAAVATQPAIAHAQFNDVYRDHDDEDGDRWEHSDRGRHNGWRNQGYYGQRAYAQPYYNQRAYGEQVYANTRVWQGNDGRYYCRRSNGTTGLLIGGAAGALLGREVAGRGGDRTLGAILGAAGGALLGRSVDRNNSRCR